MLAAANMQIEPASAPVEKPNFAERPVTMQESLGPVNADQHLVGERDLTSNIAAKGSFAMELVSATSKDAPMIRPLAEGATGVTWQASRHDGLAAGPARWAAAAFRRVRVRRRS